MSQGECRSGGDSEGEGSRSIVGVLGVGSGCMVALVGWLVSVGGVRGGVYLYRSRIRMAARMALYPNIPLTLSGI